ncbi:polynucleotidyl transferase ribonuclease H-like superfamily protein [Trifolium pratense]|uniref:Polynucleotidyl transferase ribonuclease H-like superfamily protein n=1 Tax=Trifolium pratense TaxID=57577 RepID=A0A2K3LUM1_TRIPR|nr:polynucleotidyl transferase ribonuclease H-like superfamily protein [Trifolium pratense]
MPSIVDRESFNTHDVYTVNLHGNEIKVTVTAVASVVRKWIFTTLFFNRRDLQRNRLVVGLGVQWTPGGRDPPADTLQLCVGRRCLIFQLAHATYVPKSLRNFLLNRNHTFVGFWNHSDRRKLKTSDQRFEMYRDPLDLRLYAEAEAEDDDDDEDLARASVDEIVEKCLGYEIEQSGEIGRSDWDDEVLSDEQVVYASVDAYCAFRIGKNVKAWRFTR